MWLVGTVASVAAPVLLRRLVDQQHPPGVARWAAVLLLTGPYAVFLFADYSESVFLVVALGAWYCAARDRWVLVGVLAAAATFTRINGVFLVAAVLVMYVQQRRRAGVPVIAPALLWLPLACTGFAGYFGYLTFRTGDLLAWSHAQTQGWGRTLHWPWEAFYQTAGRVLFASTPDRRFQFTMDLLFAAVIVVWTRRSFPSDRSVRSRRAILRRIPLEVVAALTEGSAVTVAPVNPERPAATPPRVTRQSLSAPWCSPSVSRDTVGSRSRAMRSRHTLIAI